jgi:hypothetical protein
MNERLTILKQHAGIDYNPDQEGLNLFAELIVEECARVADLAWNDPGTYPGNLVRKHFGVEQ